ncbi:uncharacterized protein LOC141537960 [Cotesia typhae]|uniref:uncharacterized protein LOC141537960 n=1 Tax=Cotesia typhae TaxID=2053667 RepID=UPI003D69DDE3
MFISTPGYESVYIINPKVQNELFILSHKNGAQMSIENSPYASISSIVIASFFVLLLSYTTIIINEISNLNNCNAADVDNDPQYGNSFLDTLSFIVNAGMMTPLNSLSMRVMFVVTTLLVFIVSPDIQGDLISAKTTQEYSYPKSIKNLFDLKYNVYINPNLRNTFINKKDDFNTSLDLLHSPIRSIYKCHERILNDPTTACVFLNAKQIEMAFKYDFPLTMIFEIDKYLFFWSRKNWPLKKKVDIVTLRFHETGFMGYWSKQDLYLPLKKLRAKKDSKSLSEYIPTEFEDSKFLYICLALLTLLLSVFALTFEILIARRTIRLQRKLINERRHRIASRLQKFQKDNLNDRFLQDKVRIVKGRVVILP